MISTILRVEALDEVGAAGQVEEEQCGFDTARGGRPQRGQPAAQRVEGGVDDGVIDCAAQALLDGDGLFADGGRAY
jgi:hypothetical protein